MRVAEEFAILSLSDYELLGCRKTMIEHILIVADKAGVSAEFIIQFVLRVGKNIALVIESCRV